MKSASFLLFCAAILLSGCYDTSNTYPVVEAKAALDAVPLLTQEEYDAARAEALQVDQSDREGLSSLNQTQGIQPDLRLAVGAQCPELEASPAEHLRVVAAFKEDTPPNNLILETRRYQQEIASCFEVDEVDMTFEIRTGQSDLGNASEIQLYFD